MGRPHLRAEERALVLRLRAKGLTLKEIGEQLDCSIRGKRMVPLYRRCGVIPVTKVATASAERSGEDGEDDATPRGERPGDGQEKTAKRLQLGTQSHVLANGRECKHMLSRVDGALVEVDFNEDGSELIEVGGPAQVQAKRASPTHPAPREVWCCSTVPDAATCTVRGAGRPAVDLPPARVGTRASGNPFCHPPPP